MNNFKSVANNLEGVKANKIFINMSVLKIKVTKSGHVNPNTKVKGFIARVITNGTADYGDIVEEACHNITLHEGEAELALKVCMESVAKKLKQGYIVDLGPVGRLYPSCTSEWVEKSEDMQLKDVTPNLYYRPANDLSSAIKGAILQWAKASETADEKVVEDEEEGPTGNPISRGRSAGGQARLDY